MPKTEAAKAMDDLQLRLRPFLKQHGFRMQARTCNRPTSDGLTHVINFQMGRFDPPGTYFIPGFRENRYGSFTVNIGVFVPEVAQAQYWIKLPAFAQEVYCCLRMRLGQLGGQTNVWWNLPADERTDADLRERFEQHAFPYFARHETRDALLRELEKGAASLTPRIARAIILAHRGQVRTAKELLEMQIKGVEKGHQEYVQKISDRLGLGPLD